MQNQTKKILASALFAVLGLGMLWAVGQSQATPSSTTNNITIKDIERNQSSKLKTLFLAEEKAAQTNTNPSSIEKVRLVIDEQGSLNTYATSRLLDDSQGGQSSSNINSSGSVVGGIGNRNTQETSIIIGGEKNSIEGNQGFIGGGSANTVIKANSSVLGSSGVNLEGANTFAIGSNGVNILADNATAIAGKNISIAKTAEGSLAIGNQITIATPGTFAFNTKSEKLSPQIEHSFVVNTDYGVLVNKDQSVNPEIQLNVGGAIRVGEVAKSSTIPALVQKSHGGSYSCVCFGTTAITQTDACQQICSGQTPNIKPECGPNAKAYGKDDNNWAAGVDESNFCRKGKLDPNVQNNFPKPGKNVTWKCKGIGHPDKICEATRYFCGDGIPQTGEQCDAGVLNGDPQSNCSTTCKTVAAPACGSNASAYTHTATTWKNQTAKGFCSEGTIKGTQPPFFTPAPITLPTAPSCNKCGLKGFPYCFPVSFDPNSEACRDTNTPITGETQKNWTCKNANNAEVHCEATRPLPKPGQCGTAHNVLKDNLTATSSELCKQGTVSNFGEDTTKFTNRWSWKCQGTANTPAASCTAHKPQPQAGQCGTTLNSCDAGTPQTNNTLTNGTRWICKGANQGEDTVCNVCNHNYTYNQDTNTCIPKTEQVQCTKTGAPANASYVAGTVNVTWNGTARSTPANCAWTCNSGYTPQGNSCVKDAPVCANGFNSLHNGPCAKWECDTGTTTTAGRCENKSTNIGKCVPAGGSLYHNPHSHISNNGGIAPYINQACARSNHPEACHTAIQPFVSVCLPKGGNIHTPIGNYPLLNENYIWITRTAAERIFALPDYRPTEDPCPISESEIWNGQKPSCSRGTEWRCPEMADSRAEYRNQPVCERQEAINCASLSENSCKSQSSTCTRKPGSSSTTTGYKCIRQDGQPATAADCDPTWAKPSCESEGTKNNPKLIRYSDENIGLQNQYILWSLGSVPFTSFDSVIIDARDANPEQEANAEAENKVRNTNTFRELPGTTNGTRTITISFLTHNEKRDMIVKVGSQSGGKQPYYFKLQYDPHYSDLQYYGVSNNMHQEKPYTYMFYQAYQEQTQQCNGSISLTRGYEPSQFLDPSKFFCIHHPVGKPILKKVYIKGSGNTWSNYKFYKDDKYKYPIENGLYHTNHDYVGSMNASYRFHRLKIYAMVILNGGIRDDIVLQKRNN